jgi:hypothetical protein
MTIWMSPSRSISCSPSLAVSAPMKVMPNGLSSARAAAFRPLRNSFRISGYERRRRCRQAGAPRRSALHRRDRIAAAARAK